MSLGRASQAKLHLSNVIHLTPRRKSYSGTIHNSLRWSYFELVYLDLSRPGEGRQLRNFKTGTLATVGDWGLPRDQP